MIGHSSSSAEAESDRGNYGQGLPHPAPSVNLQRAVTTYDASALETPISSAQASMATGVLSHPKMAAPSPTPFLPPPPRREPISQAGLFQTQQGHQITSNNPNQVSFPSEGVFEGEQMINHGPLVPADHHHQAMNNNAQPPKSNLPSNIHMDSPSAATTATPLVHELPIPQFLATTRNENIESPSKRPKWAISQLQNNQLALGDPSAPIFGQQELRTHGVMGPDIASPNLHQSASSHQLQLRMGAPMGNPFPFQPEIGTFSNYNSNQMRMNWIDNNPPRPPLPDLRHTQNIGVYDPLYETIGLPVDPHLRAFLAWRNAGRD